MSGERIECHIELLGKAGNDDERWRENLSCLDLTKLVYGDAGVAGHLYLLASDLFARGLQLTRDTSSLCPLLGGHLLSRHRINILV